MDESKETKLLNQAETQEELLAIASCHLEGAIREAHPKMGAELKAISLILECVGIQQESIIRQLRQQSESSEYLEFSTKEEFVRGFHQRTMI